MESEDSGSKVDNVSLISKSEKNGLVLRLTRDFLLSASQMQIPLPPALRSQLSKNYTTLEKARKVQSDSCKLCGLSFSAGFGRVRLKSRRKKTRKICTLSLHCKGCSSINCEPVRLPDTPKEARKSNNWMNFTDKSMAEIPSSGTVSESNKMDISRYSCSTPESIPQKQRKSIEHKSSGTSNRRKKNSQVNKLRQLAMLQNSPLSTKSCSSLSSFLASLS